MNPRLGAVLVFWYLSLAGVPLARARALSLAERVAAQNAIEQVYWNHRIWPKENPEPKPPLDAVIPEAVMRAKVEDYLKKSNTLEMLWGRRITAQQLQAEMDRMTHNSRQPSVLLELFAALNHDPLLVAECLARPNLADRLIRNSYARDLRFHGNLRRQAKAAASSCRSAVCMSSMGGHYTDITWRRSDATAAVAEDGAIPLTAEEWAEGVRRLENEFGVVPDPSQSVGPGPGTSNAGENFVGPVRIPSRVLGPLREDNGSFFVRALLEQGDDYLNVAIVRWPKRPFDMWWESHRGQVVAELEEPLGAYELPVIQPRGTCANDTWAPTTMEVPDPRYGHTAIWTGSEMIVWGGVNYYALNTGSRYNPSTDTWEATTTGVNAPAARYDHTAVWTGSEMIVWGGHLVGGVPTNTGGLYDVSTGTWRASSTGSNVPGPRGYHTAIWTGSEMIVWGGNASSVGWIMLNTGGRYDPENDTWRATTAIGAPSGRWRHSGVWANSVGRMIVWGGDTGPCGSETMTGGRYDPQTDTWEPTSIGTKVPSARRWQSAVWTGSEMIVWGGAGVCSGAVNTGGRYDPSTDGWEFTNTGTSTPGPRDRPTAVWTGNEMVVWGGVVGSTRLNTGGRYAPSTDTWEATSTGVNAPVARYEHTAVWTGSEMIVWGGHDDLITGGRYSPSTDTWLPTSTGATVPIARLDHMAVWTGSEMIVWGGRSSPGSNDAVGAGGQYDPATDSWTPTSTMNAPSARHGHTAVWTGSEMIVWGGYTQNPFPTYLQTGARYNPPTDTWTATSTGANVPSGRDLHTAIWTGSEMIVWGGFGGANTGGRYAPSTDSWTPTSTGTNLPDSRDQHTAVWTGGRMVVWGGVLVTPGGTHSSRLNSGGTYDPATDSWTPTSAVNAPSARTPTRRYGRAVR